jgi:hypothetical protein
MSEGKYTDVEREQARRIYADECRANGAMMIGGFGFLSRSLQRPYLERAREQIAKASMIFPLRIFPLTQANKARDWRNE